MPAPPMPANHSFRPLSGEANELLRDLVGCVRTREPLHRRRHVPEAAWIVEERADHLRRAPDLRLRDDARAAAALEVASVLRLVVGRREEARNEHGRLPRRGELPKGSTGACEHEVSGAERGAELLRVAE